MTHTVRFAVRCALGLLGATLIPSSVLAEEQLAGIPEASAASGGLEEVAVVRAGLDAIQAARTANGFSGLLAFINGELVYRAAAQQ